VEDEAVIDWLMEGDPAVRWRVLQDLTAGMDAVAERARIGIEGWGARLLAAQDAGGTWADGLYNPKWTSTFYTLMLLRGLGLTPGGEAAARGTQILLERGRRGDGGWSFSSGSKVISARTAMHPGPSETCISGMGLGLLARFGQQKGAAAEELVRYLLAEQMEDGGWNCHYRRGAHHASFNTTILALEGLEEWETRCGVREDVTAARRRGEAFLLEHRLFRSHTTGEVSRAAFLRLSQPGTWHYDVLRALEYFRASAMRDERLSDGIEYLRSRRRSDGRWPAAYRWPSKYWFELEPPREPSRLNTARALAILRWWDG
jgi:hypothetical protein